MLARFAEPGVFDGPTAGFSVDEVSARVLASYGPLDWQRIPDFDDDDDEEIWRVLEPQISVAPTSRGVLIVDRCYAAEVGPLLVHFGEMAAMTETFVETYSDEMFAGDALLIFQECLVLVHHEGVFAIVQSAAAR
jgi:hypothetical protein